MKVQKMIMVDYEIARELSESENASKLINQLLIDYFKSPISKDHQDKVEKKILEQTKELIKETEEFDVVKDFLAKVTDWTEYREGVKKGLWKSTLEYGSRNIGTN